ncbi:MAG TPA: sialidase family protein [Solirubrobacteraceae bacterium]|nr:sialidase family protein [Solirubrobacteraceae bacterium]
MPARKRLAPCRYDTGAKALEPSLDFTNDGRILFQAWELQAGLPGGVPPVPQVIRSDSSFSTWQNVSPKGPVASLDPFLTVDHRTGRVFSVNFLANGQPTCATISYSDNAAESWTSSPAACGGFDGESIAVGPPVSAKPIGYPDVVYYCTGTTPASSPPTTSPVCSKSLDGGLTFAPTGTLPWPAYEEKAEGDKFGPWAGHPIVGPDGTFYIPKRFAGQPEVAMSHDEGLTWQRVQVADNRSGGETPQIALDDSGNVFYAWVSAAHLPYLAFSRNEGRTWSAPIALAPPGLREAAIPRPAATGDGRVAVAYVGSTNSPAVPPFYEYCDALLSECTDAGYAGVTWNGYMTLIPNALARTPKLETATVDPPSQPLLVGGCSADGACKANLDFIDMKFGPDGDPFAAFVDDCAVARDFPPIFSPQLGTCGDYEGEGIVGRLTSAN